MVFKYAAEFERLNCELSGFSERDSRPAIRWVHQNVNDPDNFIPVALMSNRDGCMEWALSFFEKPEQAKAKMRKLTSNKPQLRNRLGNFIAEGVLEKIDGISEDCDKYGHFNHIEYSCPNRPLYEKFTIIGDSY